MLYDDPAAGPAGERIFNLIVQSGDSSDGPSGTPSKAQTWRKTRRPLQKAGDPEGLLQIAADNDSPKRPVRTHFTGHGSRNNTDLENNLYDLWGGHDGITVRELSKEIARLPEETPVNIVMVQCFSGAFGNLIFENGDPQGDPAKRVLREFRYRKGARRGRMHLGCQRSGLSRLHVLFFAALTGRDRVGRRVTGADYNGDGRVGMDEAYCYTLIHDEFIDVPVCTSDVFLRVYVPLKDAELFQTPYNSVLAWANPAQWLLWKRSLARSSGNRKVASVEASFGLGEALVSGLVNADVYKVRDGQIIAKTIGTKKLAIYAAPSGGTQEQAIEPERQEQPALTDAQVVRLAQLGRRIEAHFGCPQDIEWCLVDDDFQIVQSRPITTLFPIPAASDRENHVYVSVGHGQMMTDAMKPLGLSLWQLTAGRPMYEAGGRLFVDVTQGLASPASRAGLLEVMGRGDPLIGDALQTILDRGDFIRSLPDEGPGGAGGLRLAARQPRSRPIQPSSPN